MSELYSDETVGLKRKIVMEALESILDLPRDESSVELYKLHIDAMLDQLEESVYLPNFYRDKQVKQMVDKFLGWRLPVDFSPDNGISFTPPQNTAPHWWPVGTNLLTATQAEDMVRFITSELGAVNNG